MRAYCIGNGQLDQLKMSEAVGALNCMHDQQAIITTGGVEVMDNSAAVDCRNATENAEVNGTLQAKEQGQNLNSNNVCRTRQTVRRLTPAECASLQGFTRDWVDIGEWVDDKGRLHKDADSPKYKAYGNSIAVGFDNAQSGFWCWLARRICATYERQITMGSCFSGICGFELAFIAAGANPLWASEIESFPIAVAKKHFGDDDTGERGDIYEILQRRNETANV